jgi:hypothetical protein
MGYASMCDMSSGLRIYTVLNERSRADPKKPIEKKDRIQEVKYNDYSDCG